MVKIKLFENFGDISKKSVIYILGAIGILLIFFSSTFGEEKQDTEPVKESDYCRTIENRLEKILPEIANVGKVSVMVTAQNYGKITLAREKHEEGDEIIVLNQKGGGEDTKIIEESYPIIQGVIIVSDGGGSSKVKSDLTEAVKALLDVEAHKIKVFERKMK